MSSAISGQGIALGVAQETRPIIPHRAVRVVEIGIADERLGEVTRQLRGGRHIGQCLRWLAISPAIVSAGDKRFVLDDRAATPGSKLVLPKRSNGRSFREGVEIC